MKITAVNMSFREDVIKAKLRLVDGSGGGFCKEWPPTSPGLHLVRYIKDAFTWD